MTDEEYKSLHNEVDLSIPTYEIARYAPWMYDSSGHYIPFEWSEYLDVGKKFGGTVFSKAEYLIYENCMVGALCEILSRCRVKKFKILYIERSDVNQMRSATLQICKDLGIHVSKNVVKYIISLRQGNMISFIHIPLILRLLLRDVFYCELFAPKEKVYFSTPGNFYIWIRVNMAIEEVRKICNKFHIFVDPRETGSSEYYRKINASAWFYD